MIVSTMPNKMDNNSYTGMYGKENKKYASQNSATANIQLNQNISNPTGTEPKSLKPKV
jgi:hypothetical protein